MAKYHFEGATPEKLAKALLKTKRRDPKPPAPKTSIPKSQKDGPKSKKEP